MQSLLTPWPRSFRTRLNHTIDVAQLSRSLARRLLLNEDLAEAIALGHDVGHPPFGHAGERGLSRALREAGEPGWNANAHSLEVVDKLEQVFMGHAGLNLTHATREGIALHTTPFDRPAEDSPFASTQSSGLEAQVVDLCDLIAYLAHDLEDAIRADYVGLNDLAALDPLFAALVEKGRANWDEQGKAFWGDYAEETLMRRVVTARLVNELLGRAEAETLALIERHTVYSPEAARAGTRIVDLDQGASAAAAALRSFLMSRYYRSDAVAQADRIAEDLVARLFWSLLDETRDVPERFSRILPRPYAVAAFISSLNDFSARKIARERGIEVIDP